jgi:hypothetical protein
MGTYLSAKETTQNIVANAEVILNAVTEVGGGVPVHFKFDFVTLFQSTSCAYDNFLQVRGSGRLKFLLKSFLDLNNALSGGSKTQ